MLQYIVTIWDLVGFITYILLYTFMSNELLQLKVNVGLVLRAEISALKHFVDQLDYLFKASPDVELIHKQLSASKLWIKEGGTNQGDAE
jgi:hypothetical protein